MTERKPAPLAPYLVVHDGNAALDFYKRAFDATIIDTYPYEGKLGHATLSINGGEIMLSDEFPVEITGVRTPKSLGGTTTTISLAVSDADSWFDRAVAAGAKVLRPLNDEFYGRMGKLVDPYGHCWSIVGPTKT
ncbi:VOC family protein [Pendulispora brunnea]|uniref:VOC family protein n=1 Tax=Pendulispora brunnea TaxID=2905690 RepID=A0ABZ2JZ78_9BACT